MKPVRPPLLCTMGLGAHRMNVPEEELREEAEKDERESSILFPGMTARSC